MIRAFKYEGYIYSSGVMEKWIGFLRDKTCCLKKSIEILGFKQNWLGEKMNRLLEQGKNMKKAIAVPKRA